MSIVLNPADHRSLENSSKMEGLYASLRVPTIPSDRKDRSYSNVVVGNSKKKAINSQRSLQKAKSSRAVRGAAERLDESFGLQTSRVRKLNSYKYIPQSFKNKVENSKSFTPSRSKLSKVVVMSQVEEIRKPPVPTPLQMSPGLDSRREAKKLESAKKPEYRPEFNPKPEIVKFHDDVSALQNSEIKIEDAKWEKKEPSSKRSSSFTSHPKIKLLSSSHLSSYQSMRPSKDHLESSNPHMHSQTMPEKFSTNNSFTANNRIICEDWVDFVPKRALAKKNRIDDYKTKLQQARDEKGKLRSNLQVVAERVKPLPMKLDTKVIRTATLSPLPSKRIVSPFQNIKPRISKPVKSVLASPSKSSHYSPLRKTASKRSSKSIEQATIGDAVTSKKSVLPPREKSPSATRVTSVSLKKKSLSPRKPIKSREVRYISPPKAKLSQGVFKVVLNWNSKPGATSR